jgi:penicillin-binding protein 1A
MSVRWLTIPLLLVVVCFSATFLLVAYVAVIIYPTIPDLKVLTDYRPKVPLRVYSSDYKLIGEFGEERRSVVSIQQVPKTLVNAILAAEDTRFYQHTGVDYVGVARAALSNLSAAGVRQGASTITMQVARNFFLSRERTFTRKFNELLLALKIEASLPKDQILELYINQIYLGQRAYGFASAAHIYFGKSLDQLTLGETAMLAGLPTAPSKFNPVANLKRAKSRQRYVLRRMRNTMGIITKAQYSEAVDQQLFIKNELNDFPARAEYLTEMVRLAMVGRYGEHAYTMGLKVYTTIGVEQQTAAYRSLRNGVLAYDRRHGYRGPEKYVDLPAQISDETLEELLHDSPDSDDIHPAIVIEVSSKHVKAYQRGGPLLEITGVGLKFVSSALGKKASANQRIRRGSIIRIQKNEKKQIVITQLPTVEATFLAVDPDDGAIRALVGGFDFNRNKYNHAVQAFRQPGSSFKPFIYSAALEKGFTPATVIDDAPIAFSAAETGSKAWEPKNYDGSFNGPMSLRAALARSKNLVSIRILQSIGAAYAQDYIKRFGFDPKLHPPYLTMALGAGSVTPMQMAGGYSVLANGGYRVTPYFVSRIEDSKGNVLFDAKPARAGKGAERVIDPRNAYIMTSLLRGVVRAGTGARAMSLGRGDLAGKTGTTNDFLDAWFCGFNASLVGVAWVGFDQPHTLGRNETGGNVALPIWINFMATALKGVPEQPLVAPKGIVSVEGEVFYQEFVPAIEEASGEGLSAFPDAARNELF